MKILIIEDNRDTADALKYAFSGGWPGVNILLAYDGTRGIDLIKAESPDIVLLDLGLPDIDGFEVIKKTRGFSKVPIIVLTALENESDIVKAIELGADEYFIKPVGQMEIVVRIKALMRRLQNHSAHSRELTLGPWCYSPEKCKLFNDSYQISLTTTENAILQILSTEADKVVTYSALAEAIWGIDYPDSINAVRMHISRLRKKMEKDPGYPPIIIAKVGVGYYMEKS